MALFTLPELASLLQTDLDTSTANVVLKIVTANVDEASGFRLAGLDENGPEYQALGAIALVAAARLFDNPTGALQEALGSWSLTYPQGSVLTGEERAKIAGIVGGPVGSGGGRIGTAWLGVGAILPEA